MSFNGKVVIVTGGGSGLGAGAACHLSKLGAKVAIVDINMKGLSDVTDEFIRSGCPRPLSIVADVTKDQQRIIDATINHFGHLDILINSAGICITDNVIEFDSNQFDRIINVNLKSMMALMSLAVPHLEKTKGNIVNVSSIESVKPDRFLTSESSVWWRY